MKKAFFISICGRKNTGKTTLITKLIREFSRRGVPVAAVKHDGHRFDEEPEGTDSRRHREAGAIGSAVFSSDKLMLVRGRPDGLTDEELAFSLTAAFPEAEIILAEGLKNSGLPKIELVRSAKEALSNPAGRCGIVADAAVTDWWKKKDEKNVWSYEETGAICDMILKMAESARR